MARRGEAGSRGAGVRSDCWISVELRDGGGLELTVASKVASMYGERIRAQVADGCRALGLEHARVEVDDQGAVPFVLAARLECAARRADPGLAGALLPELRPCCGAP